MKKIWIHGLTGRMGQALEKEIAHDQSLSLLGGSSAEGFGKILETPWDVLFDFSTSQGHDALLKKIRHAGLKNKAFLIGTTGLSLSQIDLLKEFQEEGLHKILIAPNTSLGVVSLLSVVRNVAQTLLPHGFDVDIQETHHRHKKDHPSGTALLFANELNQDFEFFVSSPRKERTVVVQSQRLGGIFGEHTIRFVSENEEVCLSHRAFNRNLFARGALQLLHRLVAKSEAGFWTLSEFVSA